MKRIPLGQIPLHARHGMPADTMPASQVLHEVLFAGGTRGLSTADLLKSLEVWDEIKPSAGASSVLLEDAHYAHLMARLNGFVWANGSEQAAAYVLALQSAPTIPKAELVDPKPNVL